ncbi:hypothetical protein BaRGS_00003740, partial [Batillaria attramentaria]
VNSASTACVDHISDGLSCDKIPNFCTVAEVQVVCPRFCGLCACVGSTVCSLSCDFENGYCSWSQGITDDLDWSLKRGPTLTGSTGPDHDHTLQTVSGQYAYLEDNSGNPRDTADLQSPFLDLQSPSSSGTETPLWTTSGNQGQGWSMAKVTVRPVSDG